jgi:hypothetical protein
VGKETIIDLDGKYQFIETEGFKLKCDRYNEPWRDFVGDKAVGRLFSHAVELQEKIDLLDNAITELRISNQWMNELKHSLGDSMSLRRREADTQIRFNEALLIKAKELNNG